MPRVRVSTTVDAELLREARAAHGPGTDASVVEAALTAYLRAHRSAEIDNAYAVAYASQPLDTSDAWGDLASWQRTMYSA